MTSAADDFDFAETLKAKSDQLNAADLSGGNITVQIIGARQMNSEDQPVLFKLSGGHMPWKPCKGMRRLMAEIAGSTRTGPWLGKWVTLFKDDEVSFGSTKTGGIRLEAVDGSLLPTTADFTVRTSRHAHKTYTVRSLRAEEQRQGGRPTANLDALLGDHEVTREDVDRWRAEKGKPPLADLTDDQRAQAAGWMAANLECFDEIRALIPDPDAQPKAGDSP